MGEAQRHQQLETDKPTPRLTDYVFRAKKAGGLMLAGQLMRASARRGG
jgi:hypothetical protein